MWLLLVVLLLVLLLGGTIAVAAFSSRTSTNNNTALQGSSTQSASGRATFAPGVGNVSASTGHFTVSGAIAGQMTNIQFQQCGSFGSVYAVALTGTIGSKQYAFVLLIQSYHGSATYTDNNSMQETFSTYPNKAQSWADDVAFNLPARTTINGGETSGNVTVSLSNISQTGASSNVQVVGNWTCVRSGGGGGGGGFGGGGFGIRGATML